MTHHLIMMWAHMIVSMAVRHTVKSWGRRCKMSACKTHHSNPLQQHAANMATGYHMDTISTSKCHDIMVAASPDHLVIGPSSVLPSWHHITTLQGQAITS